MFANVPFHLSFYALPPVTAGHMMYPVPLSYRTQRQESCRGVRQGTIRAKGNLAKKPRGLPCDNSSVSWHPLELSTTPSNYPFLLENQRFWKVNNRLPRPFPPHCWDSPYNLEWIFECCLPWHYFLSVVFLLLCTKDYSEFLRIVWCCL